MDINLYEIVTNMAENAALTNKADSSRLGTDIALYSQGGIWYCRKNGICTIGFKGLAVTGTLQMPAGMYPADYVTLYGQNSSSAYMALDKDGILHYYANSSYKLYGVVSYPAGDAI